MALLDGGSTWGQLRRLFGSICEITSCCCPGSSHIAPFSQRCVLAGPATSAIVHPENKRFGIRAVVGLSEGRGYRRLLYVR